MPPKNGKIQESRKKKTPILCKFFNRGYCKHKEECSEKHNNEVCDDNECSEIECDKRHPNPCKFGFRCKFNKLNKCLFSHVTHASDDAKIKQFENRFNSVGTKIEHKLDTFEQKIQVMQKILKEKD